MNEFIALYISLKRSKRLELLLKRKITRTQIQLGAAAHRLGYRLGRKEAN